MDAVARELPDWEPWFTPFYGDLLEDFLSATRLAEMSIAGEKRSRWCLDYLRDRGRNIDLQGRRGGYDIVVACTDLIVPRNIRGVPLVIVQEGIVDPYGFFARLCKRFRWLPRWGAGTALTGQSGLFDRFCVASEGFWDFFVARGADPARVVVTGIPNFDDCVRYTRNDFPHRGYVLVCTSDARETLHRDDRRAFLRRAVALAAGRQLIFKLHPNENHARATGEIRAAAPNALVYAAGSAEEMIANADAVVAQWSSTVLVAAALGKEVHSDVPADELRRLVPLQNGGRSAQNIARVCRQVLGQPGATGTERAASLSQFDREASA